MKRYEFGSEEREELTAMLDSIDAAYLLAEKYRTAAAGKGVPGAGGGALFRSRVGREELLRGVGVSALFKLHAVAQRQ